MRRISYRLSTKNYHFKGRTESKITINAKLCKPLEEERLTVNFHSPIERVAHELVQDDFINKIDATMSIICILLWWLGMGRRNPKTFAEQYSCPFKGTASPFIETPAELRNVYWSLLNIKNEDEFCFVYSVLAGSFPQKSMLIDTLVIHRTWYMDQLVYKLSDFPMSSSKIPSSEKLNSVSTSVYRFQQGKLLNAFYNKKREYRRKVKLLLLVDHDKSHFCLIKDFSNFMHHLTRKELEFQGAAFAATVYNQ